ncbi:rhomboid family intramembrane serine protease [Romeria aff. gracilis LEGE 07310]|uniref:Rhomboid family intramembrane serine protease n=1 Tax=Vasconcelosia minhoensis LEGE 07310 TaxID=915328 RepID=A0A8J7AW24_9CYAN|nr:rhomboid family intramembrane serine protease [Romeria gracilis]MBE9076782.1 rhomboid family intramembrane serine protease [Romeria aff. gracilis LEGE 07310]
MVPLNDDNPISITPVVVYSLIAINIVIFLFEMSLSEPALQQFFNTYAVVPEELTASFTGGDVNAGGEWLTLISSQFLHGGFLHVGGNMLYLWVFGNNIEDQLGHVKFLIFYLACGALAALAQWFFMPTSNVPTLGASGAIAGIMGAYIIRFPRARILTLVPLFIFITTFRIPAIFFLGWWFIQQALYGLMSLGATANTGSGGVAYWAHAGGFVFGVVLGPILGLFSKPGGPPNPYRYRR